jgi:membrane-bound inhibitor of C-type lysozyme
MLYARVTAYLDDTGTHTISGMITASGGRYDDIKHIRWDDGITSHVAEHDRGTTWDYDED